LFGGRKGTGIQKCLPELKKGRFQLPFSNVFLFFIFAHFQKTKPKISPLLSLQVSTKKKIADDEWPAEKKQEEMGQKQWTRQFWGS